MRHSLRIGAAALLIASATATLQGQDPVFYYVNSLGDAPALNPGDGTGQTAAGDITLRSAMMAANADGAPSRIYFDGSLFQSGPAEILVGNPLPTITTPIHVYGPDSDELTVRSTGTRLFVFQGSPEAALLEMTITGSKAGAILNSGSQLLLENCVLRDNDGAATELEGGGAIDNRDGGTVTIVRCIIGPNNTAEFSGAVDNFVGTGNEIVAISSTFLGNSATEA